MDHIEVIRSESQFVDYYHCVTDYEVTYRSYPTSYPCICGVDEWEDSHSRTHKDVYVIYPPKTKSVAARGAFIAGVKAYWDQLPG